jgi:hypothetical protein
MCLRGCHHHPGNLTLELVCTHAGVKMLDMQSHIHACPCMLHLDTLIGDRHRSSYRERERPRFRESDHRDERREERRGGGGGGGKAELNKTEVKSRNKRMFGGLLGVCLRVLRMGNLIVIESLVRDSSVLHAGTGTGTGIGTDSKKHRHRNTGAGRQVGR